MVQAALPEFDGATIVLGLDLMRDKLKNKLQSNDLNLTTQRTIRANLRAIGSAKERLAKGSSAFELEEAQVIFAALKGLTPMLMQALEDESSEEFHNETLDRLRSTRSLTRAIQTSFSREEGIELAEGLHPDGYFLL